MGQRTGFTQVAAGIADDLMRHGDRTALVTASRRVSYADLEVLVDDAAAGLRATGERHLVHLVPAPTVEFVVSWLAVLRESHVALLSGSAALAAAYGASLGRRDGAWAATGAPVPDLHPDLRLLLSTSGSTGSPKLVRLSAANVTSNALAIADYLGLETDDVALTTLPLDYCYGLSVLHSHLAVGAGIVLDDRSVTDPTLWAEARRAAVTSFAGVPHTFELLGSAGWPDLPSLRRVTQAGGRMAPERVRALAEQGARDGWELVVMYGQTEATARMAYLPPALAATRPSAVGVAIPGGSFRLAPVDGAEPGVGELVFSGPGVMLGYAESPADLARGAELDELSTGDLARIDADGIVEIVGRRSRFAKLFGQRIDLDRVQTLLALGGYDAACAEAVGGTQLVVAVPGDPDPVLLAEVATAAGTASGLPRHALRVVPLGQLPRLANGKVDQQALARLEQPAVTDAPDSAASIALLYERVLGRAVRPDDSFVSLGGDSLSYVELALRLEDVLGRLPEDWPRREIGQLAAEAATGGRRRGARWLADVETGIVLRAVGILAIVGSHTNLWTILGGAHVLLAVAGANFARFHLADERPTRRLHRVLRAAGRIAVPAVLWIGLVTLVAGTYPLRTVLLVNDLTGPSGWSEPAWHFWFIESLLLLCVAAGMATSIPVVMALERRHRFALATGLTLVALVPRFWVGHTAYDGDVIHSTLFIAWLFTAGWAAAVARTVPERLVVSALVLFGVNGFTGDLPRDLLIAAGVLALVWCRTLPWPRVLVRPTGVVAGASLFIYLTHWQVYPHFETWWPLGGLLASVTVGLVVAHLSSRVANLLLPRLRAWTAVLDEDRPHYAPDHHHRKELP